MPKRPLPDSAAAALEIIVSSGSREIRANDLALRMHARGFGARPFHDALKAFERRRWLIQTLGVVEITEEAFSAKPVLKKKLNLVSRRRHTQLPRGFFSA